jgi:phage major head subunit gpT-like protein
MPNITFTEASGLNDSIYGKSQAPIRMLIETNAEAFEKSSILDKVFAMEKSTHYGEKYTTLTAMDEFEPVGENGSHPVAGMQEGYAKILENMTWKNSFSISREIIEDSKNIDLRKKPTQFVTSYYRTRERFGAALYGAAIGGGTTFTFGGKTFDAKSADGSALFATNHPSKVKGAAQSNKFADTFSADALAYAESAMQNFRGDNGEVLAVAPDTILIPNDAALKKAVFEAIGADKDPDTANNGFNYLFGRWRVIVWAYLNEFISAGVKPWILLDSSYNTTYGGAIFQDRTPLEVRSSIDEDTDANIWRGYSRFTDGFNDWRFAAVGGISGGTTLVS